MRAAGGIFRELQRRWRNRLSLRIAAVATEIHFLVLATITIILPDAAYRCFLTAIDLSCRVCSLPLEGLPGCWRLCLLNHSFDWLSDAPRGPRALEAGLATKLS